MLFQLHWHNPKEPTKTILVMQGEANSEEEGDAWLKLVRERKDECPPGWMPLVCDEKADSFVWAAGP